MLRLKTITSAIAAAAFFALASGANAIELAGVKLDDSAKVAGHDLVLNGAGIRTKAIFKVYAVGLYLPKKETTTDAVMASSGSRRITMVMMRDVNAEEFGQAFMAGVNANNDKAERGKVVGQIVRLGELFQEVGNLKKGDMIQMDFLPEKGTTISINGKLYGEPLPDVAFNNTLLKSWLGDKPVDTGLKPQLLGVKGN